MSCRLISRGKKHANKFQGEKYPALKKLSLMTYNAGGKIFNSGEVWEKIRPIQTKSLKSPISHSPTNVQWSCQPFRGWFDTFVNVIQQQNGWRTFMMWWFSRLKFWFQDWKYADKRHKWKEKVQKNAQFPFWGQTKAFRYEIVPRGIQPCFLHAGSERLACFEPTKAARFLKTLKAHSVIFYQRKVRF